MTDERFDELLKEMREEQTSPTGTAAARERVWRRLTASPACAEFRNGFGSYIAGGLDEARRLLVDDHLSRCAQCRAALAALRGERKVVAMSNPRRSQIWHRNALSKPWMRWAAAAGIVLAGLYLGRDSIDSALAGSGPRATVVSVDGGVYRLPQTPLEPGAILGQGEVVRTTAGAHAVLQLADGSLVEVNQRTELAVNAAWSGQTIRLDRGDVIVQAAKQLRGRLRVVTPDSIASVKGTVFAVSSGSGGSLVTVVEGSVTVSQAGADRVLAQGERAATNPALQQVQVREAVSWSQDREKYFTLLAEFSKIEKQLASTAAPALRTEPRLLRNLPAGVQWYVAIPNLDGTIRQALSQFEQRAAGNAVLREWWDSNPGQELRNTLDRLQAVTPLLGDEVLILGLKDPADAHAHIPLVMAQVQSGRQDSLRQALDRAGGNQRVPYRFTQDLMLISESEQKAAAVAAQLGTGASSPFADEIARRYRNGVGWLAAVDVASFGSVIPQQEGRILGLSNMRYLFFEQRSSGGRDDNEATLSFDGPRTGIASWLAPPGSAGSAEYVSSDAALVLSASTRDPRQAFDELLANVGGTFVEALRAFESKLGIGIGADIASSLGADFTFAVERVALPVPGWVAAFEVVKPAVLDDTVRRLADAFSRDLPADQSARKVSVTRQVENGRTWTSIGSSGFTLHWTYDRGYLVASPDRALAARAIALRESGSSLVRSASFQDRVPATGGFHHSGFVWFNTNGALADFASLLQSSGAQSAALKTILSSRDPILLTLDGEMERIHAASRTRLTSVILDLMMVHGGAPPGEKQPVKQ
jgi:hypothetical protein